MTISLDNIPVLVSLPRERRSFENSASCEKEQIIMQLNPKINQTTKSSSSVASISSKRELHQQRQPCNNSTSLIKENKHNSSKFNMTNYSHQASKNVAIFALLLVMIVVTIVSVECHIKRTQYHEQGIHGPKSYKFGFTSGDHKNPQERHETSDGHGHVKGWYSFIDPHGKHQVIHYEAHPKYGFKVYNHKSKGYNNGKRHYGS